MLTAIEICKTKDQQPQDIFLRHYSLSRLEPETIEGWAQESLAGWWLTHCPKLNSRHVQDANGDQIGWMLGVVVEDADRVIGSEPYKINARATDADFWTQVEDQVALLAGSFVVAIMTPGSQRMYFDPVMNLPAVFNAKERRVASTPLLALSRPVRHNQRIDPKLILNEGGNYGMGLTVDPDVMRGMSNHYLDLETFQLFRHWPTADDMIEDEKTPLDELAAFMTERLGRITSALLKSYDCIVPLSGGADSRTLACSARENMHRAKLCYAHRTNMITGVDCYIADQLAAAVGHKLYAIDALGAMQTDQVTSEEIDFWRWVFFMRTGYMRPPSEQELTAKNLTPDADLVLRGNILDMARANQWPRSMTFDLDHAIGKLRIGGRSAKFNTMYWGPEYRNWMDTLPACAAPRVYEFAFVELLLPQTLGGRLIAHRHAGYVNPFNDRQLIKACMSVDPKTRSSGALNAALHRAVDAPDIPMVGQVKKDPAVRRKIRKMFALPKDSAA
jgi:hypothetical protein